MIEMNSVISTSPFSLAAAPSRDELLAKYFRGLGDPTRLRILRHLDPEVALRRVDSEQQAREMRFLGSPTVRVADRDVEPGAGQRSDYGLKCRLYTTAEGIAGQPADDWIIAAARSMSAPGLSGNGRPHRL